MRPAAKNLLELSLELDFQNTQCQTQEKMSCVFPFSKGKPCTHLADFGFECALCSPKLHFHFLNTYAWVYFRCCLNPYLWWQTRAAVEYLNKYSGFSAGLSPPCHGMLSWSQWPGPTQRRLRELERTEQEGGQWVQRKKNRGGKWSMTRRSDSLSMHMHLQVITYWDYIVPRRCLMLISRAILPPYFYFRLQAKWCLQYLVWLIISSL